MPAIHIINGPNLNLLGKREPHIYGSLSFEAYFSEQLKTLFPKVQLHYFQSNHEGAIIDEIHRIGFDADGIVINAGAYTHTSIAIADALGAVTTSAIEVHISNIHQREAFRHHSYLASKCVGSIVGLGLDGYRLAIDALLNRQVPRPADGTVMK
jgi:3-dehydroquinate dehydratase II